MPRIRRDSPPPAVPRSLTRPDRPTVRIRPAPAPRTPSSDAFAPSARARGAADAAPVAAGKDPFALIPGRYPDAVGLPEFLEGLGSSPQGQALADKLMAAFEAKTGVAIPKAARDAALANPALLTRVLELTPKQMSLGIDALNVAYRAGKLPQTEQPARTLPADFDLKDLGSLAWSRPKAEMKELAPGLFQGDLPSAAPDDRVKANQVTAEVFDRLAENEGRPTAERWSVGYGGKRYDSVESFLDALRKDGHEVTVSFEQRVANFSNLKTPVPGSNPPRWLDVPAPVMVKTGIKDAAGREAMEPSVHGEMIIHVRKTGATRGPGLDADIKFFQGVSGTGFFPCDTFAEPAWCGRVKNGEVTGDDAARAVRLAGRFSRLVHDAAAKENLWCGGYGVTGVCNDSVAVVQQVLTGKTTMYPLAMRDAVLLDQVRSRLADRDASDDADFRAIRTAIKALPSDVGVNRTAKERALASLPWAEGKEPFDSSVEARRILAGA